MPTLLLIDGHSQAYRAYFGVKTPLMTRSGELTTAVYGFTRKLLAVLKEYSPEYVAVAFDVGSTWRHEEFSDYKATRDQMPDDLHSQIGRIEQVLQAFNIPVVTKQGFEADDVLGTLASQAAEEDFNVLILTGDRDMFQLVTDQVKILYTKGGPNPTTDVYGPEEVTERYDLRPDQIVDMKALVGDSSDNIPGVSGVGEKTAAKFLQQYETLNGIYENIDEIRGPKTQQSVRESEEQVRKNRRLVTIITDVDGVQFEPEQFKLKDYETDEIRRIFDELEFRSMLRDLNLSDEMPVTTDDGQLSLFVEEEGNPLPTLDEHPYDAIQSEEALQALAETLKSCDLLSFDVETTSVDATQAKLVGLGLSWAEGQGAYIPVGHNPEFAEGEQLSLERVQTVIGPILADETLPKVAHNAKYDLMVCQRHGLPVHGTIHDTMTMAFLLDPASRYLDLKSMADRELNWQMTPIKDLIGSGRKQITIDDVSIAAVTAYCGADVDATIQLYNIMRPRLDDSGMQSLYAEIETPLLPVLADMEQRGILVDTDFLAQMSDDLGKRLAEIEKEIFELAGEEFNLRSTQQLSAVLFEKMNFPTKGIRKTKSGFYSTAASELDKLASQPKELSDDQGRVLDLILEQRQLEKLRGTYVDALPALVHPETGRIHTSYNQTGASTGRLSSSDPNLQNIPIRTEIGREIRKAFIAPDGWKLIAADYSQVELRILAHVTQEEGLIEAFVDNQDIHAVTASRLFDMPLEEVDYKERSLGKTINFATIYGVSAYGLSSRTEMDPGEAQKFLDQYFATYPKVKEYIEETIRKTQEEGYVETLLGRKRFFPELLSGSKVPYNQRQALERAAINAPIQGTAADVIKIAMIRLHNRLRQEGLRARMLLQVHDELVLEAPDDEVAQTVEILCEEMEDAYKLTVPLRVDVEVGPNWYDMEEPNRTGE